jgi:glycine cleavage system H lipoate-binding protein
MLRQIILGLPSEQLTERTTVYPSDLLYSETHQWVRVDGNIATVGITNYAQEQLGDVVYVELPQAEDEVKKGSRWAASSRSRPWPM